MLTAHGTGKKILMNEQIKAGADIHAGDGGYGEGNRADYEAFVKERNKSLAESRIRDLIKEAVRECSETREVYDEILIRLIVEKCYQVAALSPCPYTDEEMRKTLGHTWDMACLQAARNIKEHFSTK